VNYKYVLFDLDGTLIDSSKGMIEALLFSLGKMGIVVQDEKDLLRFIGPPIRSSFQNLYGLSDEKTQEAIGYFRECYCTSIFKYEIYDGVLELLDFLYAKDKQIVLATSKTQRYAQMLLDDAKLTHYFHSLYCGNKNDAHDTKTEVIKRAILGLNLANNLDRIVMVGDSEWDIMGASVAGIDSIAVTYGFGDKQKMKELQPTYSIDRIIQIKDLIALPSR
jgi:phosphoglycolate phosphatase